MKLPRASEDYLETVLRLREKNDIVRSVDIAAALSVTKPSVSYTTKRLKEAGHIQMAPDGRITLTKCGLEIAQGIRDRHELIKAVLMCIGASEQIADMDACKLEHELSEESVISIQEHYLQKNHK